MVLSVLQLVEGLLLGIAAGGNRCLSHGHPQWVTESRCDDPGVEFGQCVKCRAPGGSNG